MIKRKEKKKKKKINGVRKGRKRREETKSTRGKQQKWSNREKKKVCDEAAADFFFYVSDSASFLCILFSVTCRDNILRMVRFSLCTKTTEEEIMFGLKIPGSVDTNTTGRCPDASLTDWIFLRTFADIFLCRQNVFKEHCGHFQLFSRLFLTGSWIVSIRDWFHDPHTLHILTFVSDILPIQLVNCDFVVQFWSCDVYFLSPLRPLLQFFLPSVEGLRMEDVVHCKAHWGDVIVIFGCVNKMW